MRRFFLLSLLLFSCASQILAEKPKYSEVEAGYPKSVEGVPAKHKNCKDVGTSNNHCALRVSIAFEKAGLKIDSSKFSGKLCEHGYARGASDLAAYLARTDVFGPRDFGFTKPEKLPAEIKGKKGVILFENIPGFTGQGHIDVFDGEKSQTGDYWNAQTVWFWELKD